MADLILKNVEKVYNGGNKVLGDVNLDIKTGELIVFVGPSGCGKSTLLRMIAGLESISGGEFYIDDMLMNDVPSSQRGIAMVFQSYALYPHMTVYENMAFALRIAKKSKQEIDELVRKAAEKLQLTEYLDRLPKALSGGQRQRVAIGRAIVRNPKVYLFDEPLSNLDAALRVATRIEIAQLKEAMPESTMIYVTHDQVEAMTLADRIVVLAKGGIAQVGTPLELYYQPANEFVAQFIGSPAMNLLAGTVSKTGENTEVTLTSGKVVKTAIKTNEELIGKEVNLGVRPEDLFINQKAEEAEEIYSAQVSILEALGELTLLYFKDEGQTTPKLTAKLSGHFGNLKGETVNLSAKSEMLHLFYQGQSLKKG